ncbi:glycerol dehydratase reactivase beta/small subunit family protein [Bacillus thermotolerans]|uniref:Propanediol dehydratase reactivation factor small subunit n=1 Tax=Bacillus thermotolerans TaxID=1221996 RepID=A0A0F5HNC8_BACTR|nr:glycerol dehydratase reactivase beta/small subunit family protein [Bacillus thermotolerans]KKB34520.1 Propanediol dehydratase reactivation factor small subunit [Bacillus thermotolerans]
MGVKQNKKEDMPAIHVYYHPMHRDSLSFQPLLHGIEEEGVPIFLQEGRQNTALELGYQAALDSSLGVGIGVDERLVLHYSKLKKDRPLFQIDQREGTKQRILGANAARLVKGIPFKAFDENEEHTSASEEIVSKEEIAAIVKIVVKKLQEMNRKEETR